MKIFLDTSSLFKLYHREEDTAALELVFSKAKITNIFLSELSKIEFTSTIWKKVRQNEINATEAQVTLTLFEADFEKFTFIATDSLILEQARLLISKHGTRGLRTLDSIQLATAVSLQQEASVFFTADKLLKSLFEVENLTTDI